jgi:hypothetical protein
MGIYQDSSYVQNMRNKAIDTATRGIEYNNFTSKFKDKIANGYSKLDMMRDYNCTSSDLEMYDKVADEVKHETELGNAFLQGFNSVNRK